MCLRKINRKESVTWMFAAVVVSLIAWGCAPLSDALADNTPLPFIVTATSLPMNHPPLYLGNGSSDFRGEQTIKIDGVNNRGVPLPPGMFVC